MNREWFRGNMRRRHRDLFDRVQKHTGMYVGEESYAVVVAFVIGYDEACEGGLLAGFREWLVMRVGSGNNLGFPALVLHIAFPQAKSTAAALAVDQEAHRHAIDTLFALLAEFDDERAAYDGLRRIHAAYEKWVEKHELSGPPPGPDKPRRRRRPVR